jgi:predicted enzyme related to lactoylglutathione lyase
MPMLSHVAINADDLPASLAFYEAVFGWRFTELVPGFHRMECAHEVRVVAVQQRRDLLPGAPTTGFECTVGVDDLAAAIRAAVAHGGRVLAEPATIPGVGTLAWLADPGGNVVGAMRYDDGGA